MNCLHNQPLTYRLRTNTIKAVILPKLVYLPFPPKWEVLKSIQHDLYNAILTVIVLLPQT